MNKVSPLILAVTILAAYNSENPEYMLFKLDENGAQVSELRQPLPPSMGLMSF